MTDELVDLRAEVARLTAELRAAEAKAEELFRYMGADSTAGVGSGLVKTLDACGYKYDADWSNAVAAREATDKQMRQLQARLANAEGERDAALAELGRKPRWRRRSR
jgi:hypothetical protein